MWKWKEPMDSTYNSRLESLEQLFYFTVTRKKVNTDETGKISIPFNLIKQQKCKVTIPETSPYAVDLFHAQERERFENCNKPYIFDIQGVKSIVAPLKKSSNTSLRAREHALLIENRPGQINLLSLIRNAAARLPGGVGTRADVAQLMKDSQYVKPGSSDNKLNQVVSGALDRLQSASDPPVNYDQDQKLWIYLHRLRTEEDFAAEEEGDDDFDNDE
uniref:Nuclear factor related to kappa-B-binding protein second winged helix domain-containing protein n=1 Tax=Arcella intermedia TaxID=1963864 RepID=A0A6B2LHI9_9EUKA